MKLRDEVFNKLLEILENFNYCILRNYEILPEYKNDIDILIEEERKYEAINILEKAFSPLGVKLLQVVEFSCTSLFFYDELNEQFIHIDLFSSLKWKVFTYINANNVLENRIKYRNFYIPNSYYEALELLLTRLIYQGIIKNEYKERISGLSQKINRVENSKFHEFIIKNAKKSNWDVIEKKVSYLRLYIILRNFKQPIRLIKNVFDFVKRSVIRTVKKPGMFIAFYGVDGSGKSTIIKLLTERMRGMYSQKILIFHFRPYIRYSKPKDIVVNNPHDQKNANLLRSILKLFYYIFLYNWGYYTQILPQLAKNGLVVFDRYYYDMMVDPIRYRMNLPQKVIYSFARLIPKPDLSFYLDTKPAKAYQRKRELNLEELERQSKEYNSLGKYVGKRFHIISNNGDVEKAIKQISEKIICLHEKRVINR